MATLRTTNLQHPSAASPNIVLAADGSFAGVNTNGFAYAGTVYFTSNGTFDKTDAFGDGSGVVPRAIRVRMVGGGGGGGGCSTTTSTQASVGASGGGGAYAESFITDIAGLDSTVSVTRGAGGTGGAAGNNAGSAGGASSFGSLVIAAGAPGGSGSGAVVPGVLLAFGVGSVGGGTAADSTGQLKLDGGRSDLPYVFTQGGIAAGPRGGGSFFSPGSVNVISTGANGATQTGVGVGGISGANGTSQSTARAGGAGGNGIVIIDVFV